MSEPPPDTAEPAGFIGRLRALPRAAQGAIAAVAAAVVVVVAVLLAGGTGTVPGLSEAPTSAADPVPYDGRSPLQVPGTEQRVLVELLRPPLGALPNAREMGAADQLREIKSLKREQIALRSGLQARGIVFRDVVSYYRVFNGFAATVRTRDVARLSYPGSRVRTIRRAYPASGEPVPVPGRARLERAELGGQPPVAVLDTGVDAQALAGHADPGYDAVDRDRDPRPGRDGPRREASGTALAGVVASAGERVLPIRIAAFRAAGGAVEASTTTDELIAGLEHAVDPNGDGDTSDHVPVALVGVNAPYAGFSRSPEAQAVEDAAGLGTLVVAPAGNEGAGTATIGSPAAARDALAVAALAPAEPAPHATLELDGEAIANAAVLAGDPPERGTTAGPVTETDAAKLGRRQTRIRGKVVIVRAGANPAAQAAAAAAVGASGVILADPRERALPAIPAGRAAVPVVGVTGDAAQKVLDAEPGTAVAFGATERAARADAPIAPRPSPNTAQGPSAGGLPKPDLAASGAELTVGPAGGAVVAGGTAVAAARTAAVAGRLARTRPELTPAQLRAALIAAADPAGLPPDRAGAGVLRAPAASPGITANPPTAVSGPLDPIHVKLNTAASATVRLAATDATVQPQRITLRPGTPAEVSVRLPHGGTAFGRLEVTDGRTLASVPWLVRPDSVKPVPVGPLRVSGGRRVRFTLGSFRRGPRTRIEVAERLVLDLVDGAGNVIRSLTVRGGARELMPAEYAYTIPRDALPDGPYAFRVRAWAPRQEQPTTRASRTIR